MSGDARGDVHEEIYHTGVGNLHALERSAIALTARRVERRENDPEMRAPLDVHRRESEEQARRQETIMDRHGIEPSGAKNAVLGTVGNVAAALRAPAPDEILEDTLADDAREHQEIAACRSLIAMAERQGDGARPCRGASARSSRRSGSCRRRSATCSLRRRPGARRADGPPDRSTSGTSGRCARPPRACRLPGRNS